MKAEALHPSNVIPAKRTHCKSDMEESGTDGYHSHWRILQQPRIDYLRSVQTASLTMLAIGLVILYWDYI